MEEVKYRKIYPVKEKNKDREIQTVEQNTSGSVIQRISARNGYRVVDTIKRKIWGSEIQNAQLKIVTS